MRLENDGVMRTNLHVNADHRFADVACGIEAGIAQLQAELVFGLGAETTMAFEAGGEIRVLVLLANVNFGMNFQSDHCKSPSENKGKRRARFANKKTLKVQDLGVQKTADWGN
jgi:hypothetical protein